VTIGYGPHGAETEFVSGLKDMSSNHPHVRIYIYPSPWPAPDTTFPMAPQKAISHQDSWCCYNDCDSSAHMPGDTRPIGIEVYQTAYAWDESLIDDVIFLFWEIKNVSEHRLYDCYAGIVADCDLEDGHDQCAAILERSYLYNDDLYIVSDMGYQFIDNDSIPWVGAIGFDLLQTPFDLQPGQDKDNDNILDQYERDSVYYWYNVPVSQWDIDLDGVPDWRDASENPQLEMTAFKQMTLNLDPVTDAQRYLTLAGYDFVNGIYQPYDTLPLPPGDDSRSLMSTGPFDLDPDSSIIMACAVLLAPYGADAFPKAETCLVITHHWAQWQYNMSWFLHAEEHIVSTRPPASFFIFPNPVRRTATVTYSLAASGKVKVILYDCVGQCVRELLNSIQKSGIHTISLNADELASGTYFVVIRTPSGYKTQQVVVLH
jgi:hypothetical protein